MKPINENYNGWLVNTNIDKVYENTECLINRGLINKDGFKNKIIDIVQNRENTIQIINNTIHNRHFLIKKNFL